VVTLPEPFGLAERDRCVPRGLQRALHRNQEIRRGHACERTDKRVAGDDQLAASSRTMSSLAIRRYQPVDYERVVELHVLGLQQTGTHIDSWAWGRDLESPEALAATYLGDRGDFLVGELDRVIVAMGALRPFDETRVEMKRVRVDPNHQRRGFGQAIVVRLEQRARELGASAVHLDTTAGQQPAIAMYRKLGYDEIGRGSLPRFDIVLMEKTLS
jgi:ribosomal protein S18 acetylase RimI-like enzyme